MRNLSLIPILSAVFWTACVSLEEAPLAKDAIPVGQKTVIIVYASPGPVMSERSSNLEQAAKVVPGLGIMIKASQSRRDLEASQELQKLLPPWQPAALFAPIFLKELATSGYPGRLISPAEAGLSDEALKALNRADDVSDWQLRYCVRGPDAPPKPRDYPAIPLLSDALILEVNLVYGAPSDGEGHWIPELTAVTKLWRASDMKLLWRHENMTQDRAGMKKVEEFKKQPADLIAKCQGLMPALAQGMSGSLQFSLQEAGAYVQPAPPAGP